MRPCCRISLATNATLLTEDMSDSILDAGLKFISFSIDSSSEENYKKQREGADFRAVMLAAQVAFPPGPLPIFHKIF